MKLETTNPNVITNENGEIRSLVGPKAIDAYRLRMVIIGLRSEAQGMRLTRGVNCTKLAKEITGLKTRDRAKLTERLEQMIAQHVSECAVITDGEMQ